MTIKEDFCLKKLQNFWQTKEYRLLPKVVFNHINTTPNLSDGAVRCWSIIYSHVIFDDNWSVQLSKKDIAKLLNKSPATVSRLLNELEKGQYIRRQQTKINNVQYASRIFISLPDSVIFELQQAPDRRKPKTNNVTFICKQANNLVKIKTVKPHNSKFYVEQTVRHDQINIIKLTKKPSQELDGGGFKNDMANKNIIKNNKYILNNRDNLASKSQIVVDDKSAEDEEKKLDASTQSLKAKIQLVEQEIKVLQQSEPQMKTLSGTNPIGLKAYLSCRSVSTEQSQMFLEKINRFEAIKHELQNQLACIQTKQTAGKKQPSLHYLSCSGVRVISDCQKRRLLSAAGQCTENACQQQRWVNEIAYAVRFGNLQVTYLTQKPMSVEHGLNIALKLLREGRWEIPQGMKKVA